MVLKSNCRLPRVPLLKLHARQGRLEATPKHNGIRNRGGGESDGRQARGRAPCTAEQQDRDPAGEGKQGKHTDIREWVHPLCPSSIQSASTATAAPTHRR